MIRRIIAALAFVVLANPASAQSELKFALDGAVGGASAAYVLADDGGLFEALGINVDVRPTRGALDAVSRVSVGTYAMGVADFPTFAEFKVMSPGAPVIAVMIMHDRPAFTVIGLKSHGINTVADLVGHKVGHDSDSLVNNRMMNLTNANQISIADITLTHRDPGALAAALAAGDVDAIVGMSYDLLPDLARLGVKPEDLTVLPMADNGVVLYGQVVVANTDWASKSSGIVTKVLAGVMEGWKATLAAPDAAIAAVVARDATLDPALEAERLAMIISENLLTPYVLENGLGAASQARLEWNVAQLQDNPDFINSEDASTFFDASFLPAQQTRVVK